LAEPAAARKPRWAIAARRAAEHARGVFTPGPGRAFGVARAAGANVPREVANEPSAFEIALASERAATVGLTIQAVSATIELGFALGDALGAVPRARIANGGCREVGAMGIVPAHGWRRGGGRPSAVRTIVGYEPVIVDSTGRPNRREQGQSCEAAGHAWRSLAE
jgi:hypothetical protein